MPQTRVYVALDADGLIALRDRREIGPGPFLAYAVTARLGKAGLTVDIEDLEYAAWSAAAAAAGRLVGEEAHRVIVSADVDSVHVRESAAGDDVSLVEIHAPIPFRDIVSFHVDEHPGGANPHLLWYDVTELDQVIDVARGG